MQLRKGEATATEIDTTQATGKDAEWITDIEQFPELHFEFLQRALGISDQFVDEVKKITANINDI